MIKSVSFIKDSEDPTLIQVTGTEDPISDLFMVLNGLIVLINTISQEKGKENVKQYVFDYIEKGIKEIQDIWMERLN